MARLPDDCVHRLPRLRGLLYLLLTRREDTRLGIESSPSWMLPPEIEIKTNKDKC